MFYQIYYQRFGTISDTSYKAICLLLGVVFSTGVAPFNYWPLSLLSLSLLLLSIRNTVDFKSRIFYSILFFSGFYASANYWLVDCFVIGASSFWIGLLYGLISWAAASLFMSICMTFTLSFYLYMESHNHSKFVLALIFSASWVLGEMLRSTLLSGYPMHYLGYFVIDFVELLQVANIFSIFGVSFIIALVVYCFSIGAKGVIVSLLVLGGVYFYGLSALEVSEGESGKSVSVRLINANIPELDLLNRELSKSIRDKHVEISSRPTKLSKPPEIVIWPESMLQYYIDDSIEERLALVENLASLEKIKSSKFHLVVLPLKLKNATGSPVRAIAFVE